MLRWVVQQEESKVREVGAAQKIKEEAKDGEMEGVERKTNIIQTLACLHPKMRYAQGGDTVMGGSCKAEVTQF